MRGNRFASTVVFLLLATAVMAGSLVAGTKSEGGSAVNVEPYPNPLPCPDAYVSLREFGECVDSEYGACEVEYFVCLDLILDGQGIPVAWWVYNLSGSQTFKKKPGDTTPVDKMYITAEDHLQIIDLDTCLGRPEGGNVLGTVVGGEGVFEGARGFFHFNYGSPQTQVCGIPGDIQLWYTMHVAGPKLPAGGDDLE